MTAESAEEPRPLVFQTGTAEEPPDPADSDEGRPHVWRQGDSSPAEEPPAPDEPLA